MKLSVIIVNYNVSREVDECIASVKNVLRDIDYEIIVVDNCSIERDIVNLKLKYPDVRFEFLPKNLGFGAANNYGVSLSMGDYILFLNPDTVIHQDFVTPITAFMNLVKNAGACGPMLLYPDGKYQNSYGPRVGVIYETAEAFMLINIYRMFYRKLYLKKLTYSVEVGWVSAACMLIRTEVFKSVGGFDLRYFLNYEDIDLGRKLQDHGYINYYFPKLSCIHLDHSSQKKDYEGLVYSRYESRKVFASIHYSFLLRLYVRFVHFLGLILRLMTVYLFYSGDELKGRLNGYLKSIKLYFK